MSNPSAVEFEHVFKAFGNRRVLDDVSFKVNAGEALCILGRSGTGKSVTLKIPAIPGVLRKRRRWRPCRCADCRSA